MRQTTESVKLRSVVDGCTETSLNRFVFKVRDILNPDARFTRDSALAWPASATTYTTVLNWLSTFYFLVIEFHCTFFHLGYSINIYYLLLFYTVGSSRGKADWTSFFLRVALLSSKLAPLFLPVSSVSLSCFIPAVAMRECSGNPSCMSSTFL